MNKNKIIIFGAGNCGRLIAQNLLKQGEQILCFIDNDPLKANGTITLNGGNNTLSSYPIKSSAYLEQCSDFDSVIIGTFTGFL